METNGVSKEDLERLWRMTKVAKPDISVAVIICSALCSLELFEELKSLLLSLPDTEEYKKNEQIRRARIVLACHEKDTKTILELIEVHTELYHVVLNKVYA